MSEVRGRWQRVGQAPHCVYYDHAKLAWRDQEEANGSAVPPRSTRTRRQCDAARHASRRKGGDRTDALIRL
jgi:hypothetical protein